MWIFLLFIILLIICSTSLKKIKLFPNPTKPILMIYISDNQKIMNEEYRLEIYNINNGFYRLYHYNKLKKDGDFDNKTFDSINDLIDKLPKLIHSGHCYLTDGSYTPYIMIKIGNQTLDVNKYDGYCHMIDSNLGAILRQICKLIDNFNIQ